MRLRNYACGQWVEGAGNFTTLHNAVTGEPVAETSSQGLDFAAMAQYAREVGGPALRRLTFHERARLLKALALYLSERKEQFYRISAWTGATKTDHWIDIDGGIGTLFAYASRGRREFPDEPFFVDGPVETLSKNGGFVGRHVCVPLEGVAVHINAFNFPVWGMLEKLATSLLAGVPAIVKPATVTSYLTEAVFRAMVESRILPAGAIQLIVGSAGDLLDHLNCQDAVAFTGSAWTGQLLKKTPAMMEHNVRYNQEADSLNFSMLGPDAAPGTPEFDLFVKEVAREMTVKAGQKCTAIRRTFVPRGMVDDVVKALGQRLGGVTVGDPTLDGVRMGPLAGRAQVKEVGKALDALRAGAEVAYGGGDFDVVGADRDAGAFFPITLLYNDRPFDRPQAHDVEAFGPVNTVMPYDSTDEAIALAKLGRGSLVGSLFTNDERVARDVALGTAAYHGRLLLGNRASAKESTGHGSPLPHLVHGGPGRAGGGEEMGGVRGVLHYMQRTAVQGSPAIVAAVTREWSKGAEELKDRIHPFRKHFEELRIGETWSTHRRTVTEADITNFAGISGDYFYAHVDEIAARDSLFERRVAHGYFVLSAAAGLFVDPAPGPVLANYGLEGLRFVKPVYVGDTLQVRLTCKSKAAKDDREGQVPQGVVAWDVEVTNQEGEAVAIYTVLTLVKRMHPIGGPATAPEGAEPVTVKEQPGAAPAVMA
ncbi:phenylacetic acid degradation bifunctional protein PaaZ [Roseisolibacter sp. H3M3-2]|uniref:phenylacetic acid degradation bifunctional protein PaaZ n=1 Tax=Roseisolibacter sp. H3M3-2 TaxID=3031323 RepID=UPI0023DAD2F5|nr:phenylacetic acid degradation bifunctional protein PaaZ [Roseisolibacter sp. H3M3-2]MDF1502028.1 phenylacetic acid degradation bifunctional protein PaaZ [Roseisolibacter sp. H3M3-2]